MPTEIGSLMTIVIPKVDTALLGPGRALRLRVVYEPDVPMGHDDRCTYPGYRGIRDAVREIQPPENSAFNIACGFLNYFELAWYSVRGLPRYTEVGYGFRVIRGFGRTSIDDVGAVFSDPPDRLDITPVLRPSEPPATAHIKYMERLLRAISEQIDEDGNSPVAWCINWVPELLEAGAKRRRLGFL